MEAVESSIPDALPATLAPDRLRPRLSIPFEQRLPLSALLASVAGFSLGLSHGATTSGLRFRAENAHRLPVTPAGWYLYHKSKNYHIMLGGVVEGVKMGTKLGLLVGGFFTVEEAVDRVRGTKDFFSTIVAGGGVSGVWSLWTARTAKKGLLFGLCFGIAQDALILARGGRLGYVDFLLGRRRREPRRLKQEFG